MPSFGQALRFWFVLGWISFGGPAGQIALMHRELVERRGWIDERRFLHALNFCMLLPGPEAQQLATYIGWTLHRTRGALAAGVLFVLPSLLLLIGLSWLYVVHGQHPIVASVLWGLKPVVVAVVVAAAQRIGQRVLQHRLLWGLAAAAFMGLLLGVPFPVLIATAAAVGWWARDRLPQALAAGADVPTAGCAPERRTARRALFFCLALWALTLGGLALTDGLQGTLTQMGWFFTQAALVTFGGAYAVLPYVMQGAVEQHGWLTTAQVVDGLALGETTPGPLIMVVAFVGFLGGWGAELLGPGQAFWSGAIAAVVVTWFTFLPSFLFILTGAPLVAATQHLPAWQAPLTAVTAAVVGVVLHLGLTLAQVVWWPAAPDAPAVGVSLVAWWLLARRGWGVVTVIAAGAALGLVLGMLQG